jgi:3-dehydroquinate synthase
VLRALQEAGTAWGGKVASTLHVTVGASIIPAMSCIEKIVQVSYRHRVFFTRGVFSPANTLLHQVLTAEKHDGRARALVVVDETLAEAQPSLLPDITAYFAAQAPQLELVCAPMLIEGGERAKNSYFHVSEIQSHVEKHHIDRHSYIIAVGGGALLDVAGLAAATAHRGVRHIRIPTTTLSQDDSGVGVKNGINGFGKKNFIGAFAPPFAVINDFDLLASLPERDKRAGYVEAVKVALIRDAAFFNQIERECDHLAGFEPDSMQRLIRRSAELHMNHICTSGDPFEFGSARPLDFGHWAAHKLEQISEYRIRHGEAVAVGIALDTVYSRMMGYLDTLSCERILSLLERLGFDLFANELWHEETSGALVVLKGLEEFREHLGGQLTITLLQGIGRGFEVHDMESHIVVAAIRELRDRHQQRGQMAKMRAS